MPYVGVYGDYICITNKAKKIIHIRILLKFRLLRIKNFLCDSGLGIIAKKSVKFVESERVGNVFKAI